MSFDVLQSRFGVCQKAERTYIRTHSRSLTQLNSKNKSEIARERAAEGEVNERRNDESMHPASNIRYILEAVSVDRSIRKLVLYVISIVHYTSTQALRSIEKTEGRKN